MKFTLQIELGNDAMRTVADVCGTIARSFEGNYHMSPGWVFEGDEVEHDLFDVNGNAVGQWKVTDAPDVNTARERLEALRRKYSDFGAMDTEGRIAVSIIEEAADEARRYPFNSRPGFNSRNPFQLYSSEPGWQTASAELVTAGEVYWKAMVAAKLGITIA